MGSEKRPAKGTVRGDPRLGTLKRPLTSYGEFPADLPITLILGVAKKAGELFFSR